MDRACRLTISRLWIPNSDFNSNRLTRHSKVVGYPRDHRLESQHLTDISQLASRCRMWRALTLRSLPALSSVTTTRVSSETPMPSLASSSWVPGQQWPRTGSLTFLTCAGQACLSIQAAPQPSQLYTKDARVCAQESRTCPLWEGRM